MNCLRAPLYPLTYLSLVIFIGLRKSKVNTQAGRIRVIHLSYKKGEVLRRAEGESKQKRILTEDVKSLGQDGSWHPIKREKQLLKQCFGAGMCL